MSSKVSDDRLFQISPYLLHFAKFMKEFRIIPIGFWVSLQAASGVCAYDVGHEMENCV